MTVVRAAGGVLWRETAGRVEVAVVHRPRYDDWSLPKGKLDRGELALAGAVREVAEETGFTGTAGPGLGTTRYRVLDRGRDVAKTVRWWSLRAAEGGAFVPSDEVDELAWLTVPAAVRRLTAGREDGVLERFAALPTRTSTVLLVRHARAGTRGAWDGDDAERPLDGTGRGQAAALGDLLPLWAPTAVRSAPAVRCRQTVEPVAARLGLPVELDAALAERSDGLPDRLCELGASDRTVVACSQGGVIGAAVAALAGDAGLLLPDADAPKGSVWALTFSSGRLVDADRTDVGT